jgi:hypothetical protein
MCRVLLIAIIALIFGSAAVDADERMDRILEQLEEERLASIREIDQFHIPLHQLHAERNLSQDKIERGKQVKAARERLTDLRNKKKALEARKRIEWPTFIHPLKVGQIGKFEPGLIQVEEVLEKKRILGSAALEQRRAATISKGRSATFSPRFILKDVDSDLIDGKTLRLDTVFEVTGQENHQDSLVFVLEPLDTAAVEKAWASPPAGPKPKKAAR